jgi:hypothetical protein
MAWISVYPFIWIIWKIQKYLIVLTDWEFPETPSDKTDFTKLCKVSWSPFWVHLFFNLLEECFIKELRTAFQNDAFVSNKPRLLLTAAVAVWKPKVVAGYEPKRISQ